MLRNLNAIRFFLSIQALFADRVVGSPLRSGPHAYSSKWHPIDDLKSSSKSNGERRSSLESSKSPGFESCEDSTSVSSTTDDDEREEAPRSGRKRKSQLSMKPNKPASYLPCRRSSRIIHDADVAMKYDMSSHWASRKFTDPHAFAKQLEKRRRSLASMVAREDSIEGQHVLPHQEDQQTSPQNQGDKDDNIQIAMDTRPTRPGDNLDQGQYESLSASDTPSAPVSPAVVFDDFEGENLPDQKPDCMISTVLPSALSENESPKLKLHPLDWINLSNFDHRLYSLQPGCPMSGNSVPLSWPVVKETLIKEGFKEALDMNDKSEGSGPIENQYESIRLGIEAFFKAPPEPEDKKDWTLFRTEGFDIYDKKKGRTYWKRSGDNIIKPREPAPEISFPQRSTTPQIYAQEQLDALFGDDRNSEEINFAEDVEIQGISTTDTEIDKFLALAEPTEETESLAPVDNVPRDNPGGAPIGEIIILPEQSEKTLMDLMWMPDSTSSQTAPAFNLEEIETLLDEERPLEDAWLKVHERSTQVYFRDIKPPQTEETESSCRFLHP